MGEEDIKTPSVSEMELTSIEYALFLGLRKSSFSHVGKKIVEDIKKDRILEFKLIPQIEIVPARPEVKTSLIIISHICVYGLDESQTNRLLKKDFLKICRDLLYFLSQEVREGWLRGILTHGDLSDVKKSIYRSILIIIKTLLVVGNGSQRDTLIFDLQELNVFEYISSILSSQDNRYPSTEPLMMEILYYVFKDINPWHFYNTVEVPKEKTSRSTLPTRHEGTIAIFQGTVIKDPETGEDKLIRKAGGYEYTTNTRNAKERINLENPKTSRKRIITQYEHVRNLSCNMNQLIRNISEIFIKHTIKNIGKFYFKNNMKMKEDKREKSIYVVGFLLNVVLSQKSPDYDKVMSVCGTHNLDVLLPLISNSKPDIVMLIEKIMEILSRTIALNDTHCQRKSVLIGRRGFYHKNILSIILKKLYIKPSRRRRVIEDIFNTSYHIYNFMIKLDKVDSIMASNNIREGIDTTNRLMGNYTDYRVAHQLVYLMSFWDGNKKETNERLGYFIFFLFKCKAENLLFKLEYFVIFEKIIEMENDKKSKLYTSIIKIFKAYFRFIRKNTVVAIDLFIKKPLSIVNENITSPMKDGGNDKDGDPTEDIDSGEDDPSVLVDVLEKRIKDTKEKMDMYFDAHDN